MHNDLILAILALGDEYEGSNSASSSSSAGNTGLLTSPR